MYNKYKLLGGMLALGIAVVMNAKADNGGTFSAENLSGLVVNAGGGRISIEGGAGSSVEVSPLDASGICEMTSKIFGNTLKLEKHKTNDGAISNCRIKVPAKLSLEVDMGGGRLDVKDISGPVAITKTAGVGYLSGLSGEVKIDMDAGSMSGNINPSRLSISGITGKIKFEGLTGGVSVDRTSGPLNLSWAASPSAEVKVKSDGGKVVLTFPSDARIKTELKTKENGKIHDDFSGGDGTLVSVTLAGGSMDIVKAGKIK